jgi:hypothetical protein
VKFTKLASYIAQKEGKKRQVTIGNIREILSIVCEVLYKEKGFPEDIGTYRELMRVGQRRLERQKRKAKGI